MKIPEKYLKYNLLPNISRTNNDIILHDDEYCEKLEKKLHTQLTPYDFKTVKSYISFLEEISKKNTNLKSDIDKYIENVKVINNVNNWSVAKFISYYKRVVCDDGTIIEPIFITNRYYFIIYAPKVEGSFSVYTIDENERVAIEYVYPTKLFEIVEDPSNYFKKIFDDPDSIKEREKIKKAIDKLSKK